MKYYANVTIEADDENSAKDALLGVPSLTIIEGPDPESEDELGDDDDEESNPD